MHDHAACRIAALVLALAAAPAATAQDDGGTGPYDRVHLDAGADASVETDRLLARLYKEEQAAEQAPAADAVNRAVTRAIEQARAARVEVRTAGYHTRPVYQEQRIIGWRVRQELVLESADPQRLASLLGDLQQELSVRALEPALSPQARRAAEDRLITRALDAFRHRADLVARALGRPGWRIVSLHVNTSQGGGPGPRPVMRAAEMAAATVAPPPVEGGQLEVTVRVSGAIELTAEGGPAQ